MYFAPKGIDFWSDTENNKVNKASILLTLRDEAYRLALNPPLAREAKPDFGDVV